MSACSKAPIEPLAVAYRAIYGFAPCGLPPWQVAERIIEALDDPSMVPNGLAQACIFEITNGTIVWPDDATRIKVVIGAEQQARVVFPELAGVDEVHMAQIEYLCGRPSYGLAVRR